MGIGRICSDPSGGLSELGTVAADPNATEVDEATFRRVSLYVEGTLSDGSLDPWHLETLVPLAWIDAYDVDPGEWIDGDWLPYTDFDELGVTGEVVARVEGIFASPVITEGPGRVVLTTIEHLGEDLYELTLHSADGTKDALGVTAPHRFYSESRGWVAAAELEEGEVLRGHDGPLVVTQIGRIEGTRPVYNFSVEADHVYYAGSVAALTHNSYWLPKNLSIAGVWGNVGDQAAHIVPRRGFAWAKSATDAARDVLIKHGIDIESHWNGFRAPVRHLGSHTPEYIADITIRLQRVGNQSTAQVLRELQRIRYDLFDGKYLKYLK